MQFDFSSLSAKDRYKLMVSTILPRPIAWVVTQSTTWVVNAAPYSFFNGVGADPPLISISIEGRGNGARKDTSLNIRSSGQFVVNLVSEAAADAMVITAADFAPDVSELTEARLTTVPSVRVKPPRILQSPVAFECETYRIVDLPHDRDLVLVSVRKLLESYESGVIQGKPLTLRGLRCGPLRTALATTATSCATRAI